MAEEKYTDYTVEDFLKDEAFISIVKNIGGKKEWEQFLQAHIKAKPTILKAKNIIELFETNDGKLPDNKKYSLWEDISAYHNGFKPAHKFYKLRKIRAFSKIAASVLIIFSVGMLLFFYLRDTEEQYQFYSNSENSNNKNPVLVLSDGEKIELGEDDSKITILKDLNAVQINNDSIVKVRTVNGPLAKGLKYNQINIPFGKKSRLVLEDGTKVWLNAGSCFAFPQEFNGEKREVFLKGEGYFEVAKDKTRPFIVSTSNIDIEVLGTRFNVSAYQSDGFTEAVLLEGRVNVWDKSSFFKKKVVMVPSQKATFTKGQKGIVLESEPLPAMHIAWVEGWYQFSNEGLEQVLKKLERYYNVRFRYDSSRVSKALPVSGKLDLKGSIKEVMLVLSQVAKIEFQIPGDGTVIVK